MNARAAALLLLLPAFAAAAKGGGDAVETEETAFQNVVVQPGDTLWGISHKFLKDPARWDEILKHNKLPTSDPTVALPGLVLKVPVRLIKSNLRAAHLVFSINRVLFRRKETADFKPSKPQMELFQGDTLRTLDESRARVKFLNQDLLNLEPNSMAVIKPAPDADVELRSGSVFAGRARVVTSNARVTPRTRDTRYSASVEPDLTTRVEVYKGVAAVDAQGSRVDVPAGMETRVAPGLAPEIPRPLKNAPELQARAEEFASATAVGGGAAPNPRAEAAPPAPEADASTLAGDIASMHVGVPILGYHVQASNDKDFKKLVFDRKYDTEERFKPADAGLPPGAYWWRIASIDLLGTEGRYSDGRYYTVGVRSAERPNADLAHAVSWLSPVEGQLIDDDKTNVVGVLRDDRLRVEVNGRPVRIDTDGNFVVVIPVPMGASEVVLTVLDGKGSSTEMSRRISRQH